MHMRHATFLSLNTRILKFIVRLCKWKTNGPIVIRHVPFHATHHCQTGVMLTLLASWRQRQRRRARRICWVLLATISEHILAARSASAAVGRQQAGPAVQHFQTSNSRNAQAEWELCEMGCQTLHRTALPMFPPPACTSSYAAGSGGDETPRQHCPCLCGASSTTAAQHVGSLSVRLRSASTSATNALTNAAERTTCVSRECLSIRWRM